MSSLDFNNGIILKIYVCQMQPRSSNLIKRVKIFFLTDESSFLTPLDEAYRTDPTV